MKKQFRDLLHHYKVEAFKISHGNVQVEETMKEILHFTEEALNNAYHYHFHQGEDPDRVAIFNMIKNFTLEALLPPVVEKMMRRIVVLEKQHAELVKLMGDILDVLSSDNVYEQRDVTTA